MAKKTNPIRSTGQRLRAKRLADLRLSVRQVARELGVSPIHVSDIENGKRVPSDGLLVKIAQLYRVPEAELRTGFDRADSVVSAIATESPTAACKVPEFLRSARGLSAEQWDRLIRLARTMSAPQG